MELVSSDVQALKYITSTMARATRSNPLVMRAFLVSPTVAVIWGKDASAAPVPHGACGIPSITLVAETLDCLQSLNRVLSVVIP